MAQSQVQATSLQESFLKLALLIAATPEIEAGRAYPGNPLRVTFYPGSRYAVEQLAEKFGTPVDVSTNLEDVRITRTTIAVGVIDFEPVCVDYPTRLLRRPMAVVEQIADAS